MAGGAGTAMAVGGKVLRAFGDIYSGIQANKSAKENASLLEEQGLLTRDDYFRQAALVKDEGMRTRSKQTMEYISSGVELGGTPLLMLSETLSRTMAAFGSYETTGINYQRLYGKKAQITRNEGRAAMISGIINAGADLLGG